MNNILDENSISDEDSHYIQNEIEHIIEELKQDPKFILAALKIYRHSLRYASKILTSNQDFMLKALAIYGSSLESASQELKENLTFIKKPIDP